MSIVSFILQLPLKKKKTDPELFPGTKIPVLGKTLTARLREQGKKSMTK
jgi:hypothetical protein